MRPRCGTSAPHPVSASGAVYHYFESKDAIALALAEELLGQQVDALGALQDEADPVRALTLLMDEMLSNLAELHRAGQPLGLRVQFLAEATHSAQYSGFVRDGLERIMAGLASVLRRARPRDGSARTWTRTRWPPRSWRSFRDSSCSSRSECRPTSTDTPTPSEPCCRAWKRRKRAPGCGFPQAGRYRSRKLRTDLSLTTNRTSKPATVLQDDYKDIYQLER